MRTRMSLGTMGTLGRRFPMIGAFGLMLAISTGSASAAKAPPKPAKPVVSAEQASRAVGELAGKFKWGMSPKDTLAIIEQEIQTKYVPKIQADSDPTKQDAVRQQMRDDIKEVSESLIRFNGQKTGWDVSIVDREYGHRNNEAMLVISEKETKQKRFLFFWNDKLYKQFVVLNAERFKGIGFDQFMEGMQARYGKANMSFAKKQTDDELALDFYEWPPSGVFVLRAYDQTGFYGNFCLSLLDKDLYETVEKERSKNSPPRYRKTNVHVVDNVTQGDSATDPNADVIDELVGKRAVPSVEQRRILDRVNKEYQKDKAATPKQN